MKRSHIVPILWAICLCASCSDDSNIKDLGDPTKCQNDTECSGDLKCVDNACIAPGSLGADCKSDDYCQSNRLICHEGKCAIPVAKGGDCTGKHSVCLDPAQCYNERLLDRHRRRWRMHAKFQNRCLLKWAQMHSTQMHKSRRRKRRMHPRHHELRHWNDMQKRCVHQNRCNVVPIRRQLPRISANMPTQWRLRHIRRPLPRMRRRNSHL